MKNLSVNSKYVLGMMSWMTAYAVALFGSILTIEAQHPTGLALYVLAVLPALPIGGSIWVVLRYLDKVDEYVRSVMSRRFIMTTGVTLFLCTAWGFLESNADLPHIPLYYVYVVFWGCFGLMSPFTRGVSP